MKEQFATEVGVPFEEKAALARLHRELGEGEDTLDVLLIGEKLEVGSNRDNITISPPAGPSGVSSTRKIKYVLPTSDDVRRLLDSAPGEKVAAEKVEEALGKFLKDHYLGKRNDHVGLAAAWGSTELQDADREFMEVGEAMHVSLAAYKAAAKAAKEDFQFEVYRRGDGRRCLVVPQTQLLGVKDVFHMLLQGFRVLVATPQDSFVHLRELQRDLAECGLPEGLLEVLPVAATSGAADTDWQPLLDEVLGTVNRLQASGLAPARLNGLVTKAYKSGNFRLEHSGDFRGLRSVRLDGTAAIDSDEAASATWAAAGSSSGGQLPGPSASLVRADATAGALQAALAAVKRRGPSWRDQEETYAEYELTETAETLLEFLGPRDQKSFPKQIANVLEVFAAFEPKVSQPYSGRATPAGAPETLVTLVATRPLRKHLLIPRGVGLPEDVVKVALLCEMSPLREPAVELHLLGAAQSGKLRVTDPLKSFLRVAEKRLRWKLHWHADNDGLVAAVGAAAAAGCPPHFVCVKDRHMLPQEVLLAVAEAGGYLDEGLPSDALSLFATLASSQAWTVACPEGSVDAASKALQRMWEQLGVREEPHQQPELVTPRRRMDDDIGGGFGAGGFDPSDDKAWDDISDSSSDSDSSDDETAAPEKVSSAKAASSGSPP